MRSINLNPREYWTLGAELSQLVYRDLQIDPTFTAKLHKFKGQDPVLNTEDDVKPHLAALEQADLRVGDVKLGTRIRRPAAPFTTSTMQQEASRQLKFGTRKTMNVAQRLYEGIDIGESDPVGLITYMRTDSVNVSGESQQEARQFIDEHYGAEYSPPEATGIPYQGQSGPRGA